MIEHRAPLSSQLESRWQVVDRPTQLCYILISICFVNIQISKRQQGNLPGGKLKVLAAVGYCVLGIAILAMCISFIQVHILLDLSEKLNSFVLCIYFIQVLCDAGSSLKMKSPFLGEHY